MATINTSSAKLLNKFITYFQNKRLHFTTSHTLNHYSTTLFDLSSNSTTRLLKISLAISISFPPQPSPSRRRD